MANNIDVRIKGRNDANFAFRQAQQGLRGLRTEGRGVGAQLREINSVGRQVASTLKGIAVAAGAAFGLGFSIQSVVAGLKDIIDESNNAAEALRRLKIQSESFGLSTKETQEAAKVLARQMAELNNIAESTSFDLFTKGLRAFALSSDESARAVAIAAELQNAIGADLAEAFDIVAGSIGGSLDSLREFGKLVGHQITDVASLNAELQRLGTMSAIRALEAQITDVMRNRAARREKGEGPFYTFDREVLRQYDAIQAAIANLRASMPDVNRQATDLADAWGKATKAMQEYFASGKRTGGPAVAGDGIDRAALAESRFGSAGRMIDTRSFAEELEEIRQHAREVGTSYTQALQSAVIDGLDPSLGWGEAWKNLGDNMRDTFVGQMTGAAFDPIKEAFGEMTTVIAKQFNVVGKAIANIFAPVLNIVGQVVAAVIEMIITITGIKAIATALGGDVTASAAEGAATLSATWGAAAVAASVATLGGALANVPLAIAAMAAGAAAGAGFAAGGMAEGGIVMPRPGGVLATIAEAGQPEMVIPLDRADEFGFGGGRAVRIGAIHVNVTSGGGVRDIADNIAAELDRALRRLGRERLA